MKIGDFGLATSSPLVTTSSVNVTNDVVDGTPVHVVSIEKSHEQVSSSGQLTGQIGTALYTAPELKTGGVIYKLLGYIAISKPFLSFKGCL